MEEKPLTGFRVLDFTWVRAGPWAVRWMATLGAEVIKVEWPDPRLAMNGRYGGADGGPMASRPPGVPPGPNSSGHFSDNNAGKDSVTINVRSAAGFDAVKRLIAMSDVLIENYSSQVMESWGLGYDELVKIKPDIIYVSMAGLGHTGRNHDYQTMGNIVQALSGLTHSSGLPDVEPAGWGWSYMDDTGGMYGAMSVLTALYHRRSTGQGQYVDLSQVAAGMTLLGPAFLDLDVNGRGSRREGYPAGNRAAWPGAPLVNNYRGQTVAPHNTYRTAGGGDNDWCVIACFSDEEWRALVQVMGSPEWAHEQRFATFAGRLEHQIDLDRNIEAWTQEQDKYAVMDRCQAAGVRAAPVQTNEDRVDNDPQLKARNAYVPAPHAVLGTFPLQNAPFTFSETPAVTDRAGPLVGEHNIAILNGKLGFSIEDIRAGYADGTFWPASVPIEPYLVAALDAHSAQGTSGHDSAGHESTVRS